MSVEMQHWLPLSDQFFKDPLWSCCILNLGLPLIKLHPAELIWGIMQHLQPIEGYLQCKFKNHQDNYLPSSWGSSWQNTAIEVLIPPETPELPPSEKAAPMANPSLMLWRVSPMIIIHATVEIRLNDSLFLSNSSLKTERRDKLRLRLFLRLSVVFWWPWGTLSLGSSKPSLISCSRLRNLLS